MRFKTRLEGGRLNHCVCLLGAHIHIAQLTDSIEKLFIPGTFRGTVVNEICGS
jgi:hypothetical protein